MSAQRSAIAWAATAAHARGVDTDLGGVETPLPGTCDMSDDEADDISRTLSWLRNRQPSLAEPLSRSRRGRSIRRGLHRRSRPRPRSLLGSSLHNLLRNQGATRRCRHLLRNQRARTLMRNCRLGNCAHGHLLRRQRATRRCRLGNSTHGLNAQQRAARTRGMRG